MNKLLTSPPPNPYNSHETINIEILKVSLPLGQFHIIVEPNSPWISATRKKVFMDMIQLFGNFDWLNANLPTFRILIIMKQQLLSLKKDSSLIDSEHCCKGTGFLKRQTNKGVSF